MVDAVLRFKGLGGNKETAPERALRTLVGG